MENSKNISKIKTEIFKILSELTKNGSGLCLDSDVICGFVQSFLSKGVNVLDISPSILYLIKNNPNSAFDIIDVFIQSRLLKERNIPEISLSFLDIINNQIENENKDTKEKAKLAFTPIMSQYFIDILANNKERDTKTEIELLNTYNTLFEKNFEKFEEIPLLDLLELNNNYLRARFNTRGINSGYENELFLKTICELFNPTNNKDIKVSEVLNGENKKIFKNFKFISLNNCDGIRTKKDLFNKLGLTERDFGKGDNDDNFTIVECAYLNHAFIIVIDRSKPWKDAIINGIKLIDSTQYILSRDRQKLTKEQGKENIFANAGYLNRNSYQENGTCWINSMSAFSVLLGKTKKALEERRNFSIRDIEKEFEVSKGETLSQLENEIILHSTINVFPLILSQSELDRQSPQAKQLSQDEEYLSVGNTSIPRSSAVSLLKEVVSIDESKSIVKKDLTRKTMAYFEKQNRLNKAGERLDKTKGKGTTNKPDIDKGQMKEQRSGRTL